MSCGLWFGLVVVRVPIRPSHTRDVAADLTPGRSGRRGHGPADPCRVSIRGEDGSWHFPEPASPEGSVVPYRKRAIGNPAIVEMHATLSAHPFTARLPAGRYTVTAERGKEYRPERREVTVGAEPVELTLRLRRWIDMAERGWYSGDTHTHRTLDELPNVMLAEDLNVAFPLLDWVREAFVPPIGAREASFRDPGPDPIRIDATHWILPRNTEYEIFTVGKAGHTLGAFFVLNHRTPLDLGVPPVGPVAGRAHHEGALIELDKHNWPWSMALVPIMPVDLYELSNNHVWQTEFAFRDFGEARRRLDGRGDGMRRASRSGAGSTSASGTTTPCSTAASACGRRPAPPRASIPCRSASAGSTSGSTGASTSVPGSAAWTRGGASSPPARCSSSRWTGTTPVTASSRPTRRPASTACGVRPSARCRSSGSRSWSTARSPARSSRPTARPGGAYESPIDEALTLDGSSWVAVRCFEDRPDGRVRFAHSGPFHIDVAGRRCGRVRAEVEYLVHRVEVQIDRSADVLPGRRWMSTARRSGSTASSSRPPGEVAKARRTKGRRTMILAISLTTLLLSQAPHVELDFNSMGSGDWNGKRFNEIVPARTIKGCR